MTGQLILARHGESELDAQHRFSGTLDPPLSKRGVLDAEALEYCFRLYKIKLEYTFSSGLVACRRTAETILHTSICKTPISFAQELDERDYGPIQGLSRSEAVQKLGEEQVMLIQHGSTDADPLRTGVAAFYRAQIVPKLEAGAVVLIVSYDDNLAEFVELVDPEGARLSPGDFRTGAAIDFRLNPDMSVAKRNLLHETRWADPV